MNKKNSNSIGTFTLWEKFSVQFSFWAGIAFATYGLYHSNAILGVAYPLMVLGAYFLLMRYTVCPRCPYLFIAGDCLQVPARLTKIIVSPKRNGPLNRQEKIIFNFAWYGSLLIPNLLVTLETCIFSSLYNFVWRWCPITYEASLLSEM